MQNHTITFLLAFSCLAFSCSRKVLPPPAALDETWTLDSAPNALDVVGVVFAVDENGNYKSIPGGTLNVKVLSSPVAVTERTKTKDVSLGLIVNFLAIKNLDSLASAKAYDSTKVTASFTVVDGKLFRIDDDILKAFDQKKAIIESNIEVLGLQKSRLFIILEAIQSSNVNITLNKRNKWGAGINAKVKKLIKANLELNPNTTDNSSLAYKNSVPVTIFYKLNTINIFRIKGDAKDKYEVELGSPVSAAAIIMKK